MNDHSYSRIKRDENECLAHIHRERTTTIGSLERRSGEKGETSEFIAVRKIYQPQIDRHKTQNTITYEEMRSVAP